ncbi:MAG: hypothetical protein A2Y10_14760 [Planctomycetes bacterium GWF2_41_51]|nr:MAG: hypothetical protein A2Y10_14760 [Planctomycetes bacterium GWF2_41_51]HBG28996.1 hypothetical protein [Phycisphaerales bacterium]
MMLIENLLIGVIHIAFAAIDVLFLVILLKVIYDRWQIAWIEPILTAIRPMMSVVMNRFAALVLKATGKSYPEKTWLVLLIICLLVIRFLIVSILR